MKKETILIVDDIESNIDILNDILGYDYDIMVALNANDALELAQEYLPDLILLDIMIPDMDGYKICQELKKNPQTANIPVIFSTARTDENSIEKAYNVGGIDYICKPFKAKEIKVRVGLQLKIKRMLKDLEKSKKQLGLLASIDPLTKLYNRRYFRLYSDNIIANAKKHNIPICILMFDLDDFKQVNDTYGHNIGDKVLIEVANLLQRLISNNDIVCRYGGEEFVIMFKNSTIKETEEFAFRLKDEMSKIIIKEYDKIKVSASIGVSSVNLKTDNSIEEALNRADSALYDVKCSTKNDVKVKV
jgi:diguanylate cyclase (GGDEF)-like protein